MGDGSTHLSTQQHFDDVPIQGDGAKFILQETQAEYSRQKSRKRRLGNQSNQNQCLNIKIARKITPSTCRFLPADVAEAVQPGLGVFSRSGRVEAPLSRLVKQRRVIVTVVRIIQLHVHHTAGGGVSLPVLLLQKNTRYTSSESYI